MNQIVRMFKMYIYNYIYVSDKKIYVQILAVDEKSDEKNGLICVCTSDFDKSQREKYKIQLLD